MELLNSLNSPKIYSIAELNSTVRTLLEDAIPVIWISGEISNLYNQGLSGHLYFSLKDSQAQVRCAMFRNYSNRLDFKLKNGMQVIVQAQVSLYETRGEYQLLVYNIEEAGVGLLQQKFAALKEKLQQEGLFATEHKKPLPAIPNCIGIVTSPSGAAVRDILSILRRRFPSVPVIIYPTLVQGSDAAPQIVNAIETANFHKKCDVLIVSRGGGSLEDLWPFNEETVARSIYASEIPTISAVGHEIDFTIADFVADLRAPTPSAAAELVVPNMDDKLKTIQALANRLTYLIQHKLEHTDLVLSALVRRLHHQHPINSLHQYSQRVDELQRRLVQAWQYQMSMWQHKLAKARSILETLNPLTTLQRGYAIVRRENKGALVSNTKDVQPGNVVDVLLAEGELKCEILSINQSIDKEILH